MKKHTTNSIEKTNKKTKYKKDILKKSRKR